MQLKQLQLENTLTKQLCRLARFGANISDAFSCFIFLPDFCPNKSTQNSPRKVRLFGFHSLSQDVVENCEIYCETGLIGWVATHKRSIHVSPFELDSRTLGIYHHDQMLKSFIGIPIDLDSSVEGEATSNRASFGMAGVIACDSKKSFAFSKLQGKLLEDLALETANTVRLLIGSSTKTTATANWSDFLRRAIEVSNSLGSQSIEVMRIVPRNLQEMERALGTGNAIEHIDQLFRLIQQSLPGGVPVFRMYDSSLILVLDNMTTSFYESRFRAVCDHVAPLSGGRIPPVELEFRKCSPRNRRFRGLNLEQLITQSAIPQNEYSDELNQRSRLGSEETAQQEVKFFSSRLAGSRH